MKLNVKLAALAVATLAASAANAEFISGTANPNPVTGSTTGEGSLGLLVYNTQTSLYYVRDLGFTINSFLPNSGAAITRSGEMTPVYDKTPEAGLTLDKTNTANFADASFSTWLGSQNVADLRWMVMADDGLGLTATNNKRLIGSVGVGATFAGISNGQLDNSLNNVNSFAFASGLSSTGTLSPTQLNGVNGSFVNQAGLSSLLGGVANLYYWTRSANTGSTSLAANQMEFGNSQNLATVSLALNGDFTYTLAAAEVAAVPLPAAAWLLGAGLMSVGGMVRRRRNGAETA